ncbi:MAG: enoyl-CoA hydratase/isomerase family protein [Xanthomonadales bacterium]|nr:enoyl-CoA hydratase/isomerase family protein [Xanthomonadales bacterium]
MNTLTLTSQPSGLRTITLNRPRRHNAFDDTLIAELTETLEQLAQDATARVLVLTGAGASFSAGADLNWMQRMASASEAENEADALRLAALLRTLNYLPLPTIARVNGAALGGGVGLAACCDVVIAADHARFGLTETRLGLVPAVISPYVMRRLGETQARRYFLSGERFHAQRAQALGLVHEVTAPERLDEAVQRLVASLAKGGPQAVSAAKQLVFRITGHSAQTQAEQDRETARLIAALRVSDEGQEGMHAFLEKRKPDWIS